MSRLLVPAPDGFVEVILEPLINDSDTVLSCTAPFPAQEHTATGSHILLVPDLDPTSVMLCDGCATGLLEGSGDVLFGL